MADTITSSGLITSFSNTPQAKDDLYTVAMLSGLSEDGGSVTLDVMANDLGGKAKTLYSLDDGIENEGSASSADLLSKDVVGADNFSKWGALIEFTGDGKVAYTMTDNSKAHFQSLAAGEIGLDTFTYAIRLASGALSWSTVTVQIQGTNDAPVITGATVSANMTETDVALSATGTLNVVDADLSDTVTMSVDSVAVDGSSTFAGTNPLSDGDLKAMMAVTGGALAANPTAGSNFNWTFTSGSNGNGAFNFLGEGETLVLKYSLKATDDSGVALNNSETEVVTITITGTNDTATITANSDYDVKEAGGVANGALGDPSTSGTVTVHDADTGQNVFQAVSAASLVGTYGSFTFNKTSGEWTYTLDQSKADKLTEEQQVTDNLTVTSFDGTASHTITVTITGTNDTPTVSAALTDAADEGDSSFTVNLLAGASDLDDGETATLSVANVSYRVDGGASSATAPTGLSLSGSTLSVDPTNSAFDHLAKDDTTQIVVTFDVTDAQGDTVTQTETITITGTNDDPMITVVGTDSATSTLTETNAGLSSSGTLTVTDVDFSDTLSSTVLSVVASGTTVGLGLTAAQLLSMFSVTPTSGLAADAGDTHNLSWTFNSGAQAFDYLTAGQSLQLTYTIQSTDTSSASDTQTVTVTINGTNDIVNTAPDAQNDVWVLSDNTTIVAGIIGASWFTHNDTDTDGNTVFVTAVSSLPSGLTAHYDSAGHLDYIYGTTPSAGTYTLNYTLSDGTLTDTASVSLRVVGTTSGTDTITLDGNDFSYIDARTGADSLTGDTLLSGNAGIDTFLGGNGNDTLLGGAGNDTLYGEGNDDVLNGGAGDDILNGGNNNDTLIGGAGSDTLTGGSGNDIFKWTLADASSSSLPVDTIKDWGTGTDKLDIKDLLQGEGTTAASLDAYLDFTVSGGNTTIAVHSGGSASPVDQTIILQGVTLAGANDQAIIQTLLTNSQLIVGP